MTEWIWVGVMIVMALVGWFGPKALLKRDLKRAEALLNDVRIAAKKEGEARER